VTFLMSRSCGFWGLMAMIMQAASRIS